MGSMYDRFVKTDYLRRLDAETENRHKHDLNQALIDFGPEAKGGLPLIELAKKYGVAVTPDEEQHVLQDWLSTSGWFQNPNNNAIMRLGMYEAVKMMVKEDLPIDAYWACMGGDPQVPIQIFLSKGDSQITMVLFTPMPPPAQESKDEPDIWVALEENGAVIYRHAKV